MYDLKLFPWNVIESDVFCSISFFSAEVSVTVAQRNRRTRDGIGCEFESWECRINIVSYVHKAYYTRVPSGFSGSKYI